MIRSNVFSVSTDVVVLQEFTNKVPLLVDATRRLIALGATSFEPTNGAYDGKYRQVEVRLPKRKDLKARTKKGYTAIPPRAAPAPQ